ncbi:hypothetical protein K3495_g9323 [Podosphaera aphanis]|nr:hypothetical protein K3495_g9323 [Podosphaera aphanis]
MRKGAFNAATAVIIDWDVAPKVRLDVVVGR